MKLYWGPHTCAIGIHVLLEEVGASYETEQIDVEGGATRKPTFLGVNPKGKVPVLVRDDGSVLTEFGAIAWWLGRTFPESALIPSDGDAQARMLEMMNYIEGMIHGQGFARMFAPAKFEPQDIVHQATSLGAGSVKAQGLKMVEQGFAILDPVLALGDYAIGNALTIADAALFYVERWAPQHGVTLPVNLQRHLDRMSTRPSVRHVRRLWGENGGDAIAVASSA